VRRPSCAGTIKGVVVRVRPTTDNEIRPGAALLARSFDDDPLFRFLFPRATARARVLTTLFTRTLADAKPFQEVYTAHRDDELLGVLACLPPGAFPPTLSRTIAMIPALASSIVRFPRSTRAIARVLAADAKAHVSYRHWYIPCIAVEPTAQQRGIGTLLLNHVLTRIDNLPTPVFLVTSRPRNLAWYERHRFTTVTEMRPLATGPPCWALLRPAAQPATPIASKTG
jgi:ribosomal protein S18 acetylase RimI-like enzyme